MIPGGLILLSPLLLSFYTQAFFDSDVKVEGMVLRGLVLFGPTLSLYPADSPPLTGE